VSVPPQAQGCQPSTSICNLLFTFTGAAGELGERHLPRGLDFFDLLGANEEKHTIPSSSRARAILWLLWRYHEGAHHPINLFEDHYSAIHPGQATHLPDIGAEELQARHENVDLDEELRWGYEMEDKRRADMIVLKETGGVGRGKKGEKRSAFWGAAKASKKPRANAMDDIEAELDAMSATDGGGGGRDDSSMQGDKTFDFDDDDDDELDEEVDELLEDPPSPVKPPRPSFVMRLSTETLFAYLLALLSPTKVFIPTLDISYYLDQPPAGPPREKRLLHRQSVSRTSAVQRDCC
jgi:hypothetical protein